MLTELNDAPALAEASVGKSFTMKRFATRGRGKSTRILKPFSRVRIVVRDVARRTGYRIDDHRLELFGLCPDCLAA